nr:TPA_asm: m160 uORF [Murid betaherpesvirus 1]DBA08138.1 TPA_asm: m160 uORF [Murid betaherpesvirus 1]
MWTLNT